MTHVIQNMNTPALSALPCSFKSTGGGGKLSYCILVFSILNYLMNTLARKFKNICDCAQRFSAAVKLNNLRVSTLVSRWSRAQRSPLPIRDLLQTSNAFRAQLASLVSLTHITYPGTQRDFTSINVLNKDGGNSTVPFAGCENIQTFDSKFEACVVVHG